MKRNMITEDEFKGMTDMLKTLNLPVSVSELSADSIIETSKSDKKMDAGKIKFILLDRPGNAVIRKDVTDDEMREALSVVLA